LKSRPSSPITAGNTAVRRPTPTNSTSFERHRAAPDQGEPAPDERIRREVSTGRPWASSSARPSGRSSTSQSRPSRPTSTPGSCTTTPSAPTEAITTCGDARLRPSTCTWRVLREKVNRSATASDPGIPGWVRLTSGYPS
jgi:hypothetical protein